MNWQHLKAILWLRWRMSYNQWQRSGTLNAIVTAALVVALIAVSGLSFFAALIGGSMVLLTNEVAPDTLMYTWDVIVLLFLFVWCMGLITELQRSELLSLDRLLHLPLSLASAFVLNYATSLLSLPVIMFLPGMVGLALACTIAEGPAMLAVLPLVAAFMLFVTAVTYQLRGWLATLMQNKRRRRTILMVITVVFILLMQTPQLLNFMWMGNQNRDATQRIEAYQQAVERLNRQLQAGEITVEENAARMQELQAQLAARRAGAGSRFYLEFRHYALLANQVVPIGWLPYGVRAAAAGSPLPAMLASLALFAAGALSLWRSYAATMRFYTGSRPSPKRRKPRMPARGQPRRTVRWEPHIPMASQHVNAVAIVSFRCLLRAPEAKLALLTPLILAGIFGGMVVIGQTQSTARPGNEWVTPFVGIGIIGATLFGLAQLMINIFGMDRGGFRAFVLMPVRRRDVLVGKNLSLAPLAGGMSVALVLVLQLVSGMRPAHLLATLIQLIPSYLVFCLIGNTASILAPSPVASGSLKPVQPNLSLVFTQLICTMFAPIALVPAMVALGMELALASTANIRWLPVYLVFSLAEAVLVIGIYRRVVTAQGEWLERRESRMLEVLTQAPE